MDSTSTAQINENEVLATLQDLTISSEGENLKGQLLDGQTNGHGYEEVGIMAMPTAMLDENEKKTFIEHSLQYHRILLSTVESILNSDPPLPGVPPEAIRYLKEIVLCDIRLRKFGCNSGQTSLGRGLMSNDDEDVKESSSSKDFAPPYTYELPPDVKSVFHRYVNMNLVALAQSIVKTYLANLKGPHSKAEDHNIVQKVRECGNPLQEIIQLASQRYEKLKLEEAEIERLNEIRDNEHMAFQTELSQLKELLSSYLGPCLLHESPAIDAAYIDYLKAEGDNFIAKTHMTKMCQLVDENPPELISEYEYNYKQLVDLIIELEDEILVVDKREAKFKSLTLEFQQLLRDREKLEKDIITKEWTIRQLENFVESSSSLDDSFY